MQVYRVCPDCGAMLDDSDEDARKHAAWHLRLVDVLALLTTNPKGAAEILERLGKS